MNSVCARQYMWILFLLHKLNHLNGGSHDHRVSGVISIFLYVMVLQSHSHTQCIGSPTFRVDSPSKPLLAV